MEQVLTFSFTNFSTLHSNPPSTAEFNLWYYIIYCPYPLI